MSSETAITIAIDQLKVGMYVTKLDISWLDSPFMSHSRLIKSQKDIAALHKAGVKKLIVDISKGEAPDGKPSTKLKPIPTTEKTTPQSNTSNKINSDPPATQKRPSTHSKPSLKQEMNAAVSIRNKVKKAVTQLQSALEAERKISVSELTPLIDQTLTSLERNDQALMNLVHLSRKSQKLSDHSFGAFCLVLNLAKQCEVSAEDRDHLGLAALLHEAGWSQLPLNLMGKRTRYTPQELALVEKHTELGEKMLAQSELPELTMRIIREHHELLNGSGYPNGLKGEEIHPLSGYLSVVDSYEERVHQLLDMPGMVPHNALRALYHDAEKGYFCAEVVASFISMLGIYPVSSGVVLNTQEKAVVVEFHKDSPLCPTIKICYDGQGCVLDEPLIVDLRESSSDSVIRSIENSLDVESRQNDPMRRLKLSEDDFS